MFRNVVAEWDAPIADLRDRPPGWIPIYSGQESDGCLWCIDVNYHRHGHGLAATVQTARPLSEHHRMHPNTTPETELWTFLANSGRIEPVPPDFDITTGYTSRDIEFEGLTFPVHVHRAHGCSSARFPLALLDGGYVIVTAVDEHWATATDLVLRHPADR
ncbi:hypothetical protein ACFXDE_22270 [Kitasatospora sp. NPDC059408]|uniref:hypothetical protein n=1 Tax=Kitasatospora sp. NPDC059408 TaxID=3346823 RepID=UPI0036BF6754